MKVLVTGATGAIGSALVTTLLGLHCEVVAVSRSGQGVNGAHGLRADFAQVPSRHWWSTQLEGVDVVVNAVGILRECGGSGFGAVHFAAPLELFQGCVAAGVRHVVQLSALGADADAATPFHRSKRSADDALRGLPVASTIVQPSLVYGPSVQSAALFDALAACPWIALPRGGAMAVQPVVLPDVVEGLARIVMEPAVGTRTIAFVGPEPVALRRYLEMLRERQGAVPHQHVLAVPDTLAIGGARLLGTVPGVPITADAVRMLVRGNTADVAPFARLLQRTPRSVRQSPDPGADAARRRAAVLSLWLPPLRCVVALLWLWTGAVSLGLYPTADSLALLATVGVTGALAPWALYAAAVLDVALGVLVLCTRGRMRRWVWLAQLATMAAYTVALSIQAPEWWLHPFGPLSKNLPLAALIGLLWALEPVSRAPASHLGKP